MYVVETRTIFDLTCVVSHILLYSLSDKLYAIQMTHSTYFLLVHICGASNHIPHCPYLPPLQGVVGSPTIPQSAPRPGASAALTSSYISTSVYVTRTRMIDTTIITTALQLHDPRFTCTGRLPVFEPGTDTRALNVSNSDVGGEMSVA